MKINSICIVGGGSAGWMTAAVFAKLLKNIKVTLVESPEIPKIGVGESTIQEIDQFFAAIGVDDSEWMKECDASFKLGINFIDFYKKDHSFIYPFFKHTNLREPTDWFVLKQAYKDFDYSYGDFTVPEILLMCKKHKISDDISLPRYCINRAAGFKSHAYQLDATKFATYLKNKVSIPAGVTHIVDHVTDYEVLDDRLKSVKTQSGKSIEADLFIDCTGYRSSILEGVFKSKHMPFKHLLNDSAMFGQVQYTEESKERELHTITDCTGIDNGWCWNVPLWSRIGTGYVYSSKHVDKDKAQSEFVEYLTKRYGHDRVKDVTIRSLEMRNGRHEKVWVSNVVAIGLSYGFIEPIESTGLYFIHDTVLRLAHILTKRDGFVASSERHFFNKEMNHMMDNISWWIAMHFFLSKRDDTQYWRDWVENTNFDEVYKDSFYMSSLEGTMIKNKIFNNQSYDFIAFNMDMRPTFKDRNADAVNVMKRENFLKKYRQIESVVDGFPSHYEYLRSKIYM